MNKNVLAVMALTVLVAISMLNAASAMSSDQSSSSKDVGEPLLKTMQLSTETNETELGQSTLRSWNNFAENLNYSVGVLNESLRGNLTPRDAMVLFTTLLVLNSNAMSELEGINPGPEYADFRSYTLDAMKYFNRYLGNMAKYYESENALYANLAMDNLTMSQEYYTKGRGEAEFLF